MMLDGNLPQSLGHLQGSQFVRSCLMWLLKLLNTITCTTVTHYWLIYNTTTTTTATILQPLYRTTCVSRHPQLRTGGFCWSKALLLASPCWWQLARLD